MAAVAAIAAAIGACSDSGRLPGMGSGRNYGPPSAGAGGTADGAGGGLLFDAGSSGPPSPDATNNCGNQVHGIAISDAPNVYFVLDVSGSMATPDGPKGATRYSAVRGAAADLVRKLGTLINVGAALFPVQAGLADSCHVGGEVFPVTPGSPPLANGDDGPTTAAFLTATQHTPNGGTPTAATLAALHDELAKLSGKTIVLLATDGGPNCNAATSCDAAHCIPNIEGQCAQGNCCAPTPDDVNAQLLCLDEAPTLAAIDALHQSGITVYVIGIATAAVYQDVLDAMAKKGGAPLPGAHAYYQVDDLGAELVATLGAIAGQFISCDFKLKKAPEDPTMTNVWLDQTLLSFDPIDGWTWKVKYSEIELVGKSCAAVKGGQVSQVQIVEGCPTQVSK